MKWQETVQRETQAKDIGNINYGYTGAVIGIPWWGLDGGGRYAAEWHRVMVRSKFDNEIADEAYVNWGVTCHG